jgi:hypothetical protein
MITGAHAIIYSTNAEADRAFLRDVLRFTHVDVGDGWLIFGLPPAEVAVHPSGENDTHELYFMCDNVAAFVSEMSGQGIDCTVVENLGWGLRTQLTLPGGGRLGVYEPRHARPAQATSAAAKRKPARRSSRKAVAKPTKKRSRKATAKKSTRRSSRPGARRRRR